MAHTIVWHSPDSLSMKRAGRSKSGPRLRRASFLLYSSGREVLINRAWKAQLMGGKKKGCPPIGNNTPLLPSVWTNELHTRPNDRPSYHTLPTSSSPCGGPTTIIAVHRTVFKGQLADGSFNNQSPCCLSFRYRYLSCSPRAEIRSKFASPTVTGGSTAVAAVTPALLFHAWRAFCVF